MESYIWFFLLVFLFHYTFQEHVKLACHCTKNYISHNYTNLTQFQPAAWHMSLRHHWGFLHRQIGRLMWNRRGCKSSQSVNPCARLQFLEDDENEQNHFVIVTRTAPGPSFVVLITCLTHAYSGTWSPSTHRQHMASPDRQTTPSSTSVSPDRHCPRPLRHS